MEEIKISLDELATLIVKADICPHCEYFVCEKCDFYGDLANEKEPLFNGCFKACKKYLTENYLKQKEQKQ